MTTIVSLYISGRKVAHVLEVGDEAGSGGVPSQRFPCMSAGGRNIPSNKRREPAKMVGRLFGCEGDHGHLKTSTDGFSDVADGHTPFRDGMKPVACVRLRHYQLVQPGSIEAMSRGPAVEPIAHVRRNTLFARHLDRIRDKTLLHCVMDLGKPHDGSAHPSSGDRSGRFF